MARLPEFGLFFWGQVVSSQFALFIFACAALTQSMAAGRYDLLLVLCLGYQAGLVGSKRESWHEFWCIGAFHLLGLCLELYKVRHGSWTYPEPSLTKFGGVPLFSGFMYASVASYVFQAWRRFGLEFQNWPRWPWILGVCGLIYANFYLNRVFADNRWIIAAIGLAVFWRTRVHFTVSMNPRRWMPMPLAFTLIGFFVWVAEHICTYLDIWRYPNQLDGWTWVSVGKLSSWVLLTVVSVSLAVEWKRREAIMPA